MKRPQVRHQRRHKTHSSAPKPLLTEKLSNEFCTPLQRDSFQCLRHLVFSLILVSFCMPCALLACCRFFVTADQFESGRCV